MTDIDICPQCENAHTAIIPGTKFVRACGDCGATWGTRPAEPEENE